MLRPLKRLFTKVGSGAAQLTPPTEWTIEAKNGAVEKHELWVEAAGSDNRDVRVMAGSAREQDAEKLLDAHRKRAESQVRDLRCSPHSS